MQVDEVAVLRKQYKFTLVKEYRVISGCRQGFHHNLNALLSIKQVPKPLGNKWHNQPVVMIQMQQR